MENVNEKATRLKEFFEANKIECFEMVERQDEAGTAIFRSRMQIKGQVLPFAVLVDNSVYTLLQIQLASAIAKGDAFAKVAAYLNNLNNKYRVFKFVVTDEGDLLLNVCIPAQNDKFDPVLINAIIGETVKALEVEYASMMAKVWDENK